MPENFLFNLMTIMLTLDTYNQCLLLPGKIHGTLSVLCPILKEMKCSLKFRNNLEASIFWPSIYFLCVCQLNGLIIVLISQCVK